MSPSSQQSLLTSPLSTPSGAELVLYSISGPSIPLYGLAFGVYLCVQGGAEEGTEHGWEGSLE